MEMCLPFIYKYSSSNFYIPSTLFSFPFVHLASWQFSLTPIFKLSQNIIYLNTLKIAKMKFASQTHSNFSYSQLYILTSFNSISIHIHKTCSNTACSEIFSHPAIAHFHSYSSRLHITHALCNTHACLQLLHYNNIRLERIISLSVLSHVIV